MLLYTRSHHQNRFQKLFAIYFKFRGLSAKGFDTLHALGLIMSHKWACDSVSWISQRAIMEAHILKDRHLWLLSYDNVISLFVFSPKELTSKVISEPGLLLQYILNVTQGICHLQQIGTFKRPSCRE